MRIGVPKETAPREARVALAPVSVAGFTRSGVEVLVQSGAGDASFLSDDDYREAGAEIAQDAARVYADADVIVKVAAPSESETAALRSGQILIALLQPLTSPDLVQALADRRRRILQSRCYSPHSPRPANGCAVVAGFNRWI